MSQHQQHLHHYTQSMENNKAQRIYVGGLDPSRGLTVELVASRLRAVKDVEITSINDVAIEDQGDATCPSRKPIYNPKHRVIDEDGDLVDTRKFFYIEARSTGATSTSALDLLAKQYHNTKWKGCSLRVEEAKPHFLKRLEQEREEREAKAAAVAAVLSADVKEPQSEEDDVSGEKEEAKNEIKNKRRLRIRQRFGAEAFLVDTHPRQIQLGNGSTEGWNDFASLRARMINKRESQRKNLIERRKQERRSWAGGKGNAEPAPPESNDLRSLIFLNRGIHIRFDSIEATDLVSDDNSSDVSKGDTEDVTESDESSSSSDSDESSMRGNGQNEKAYMWSDDEDEADGIANSNDDNNSSSDSGGGEQQQQQQEIRNEGGDSDDESFHKHLSKPTRTNNLRAGAEYTRAVVADEFAFGADDLDFDPSNNDTEDVDSDNLAFDESMEIGLEDDITSNMNILSKLFPGDYFESKPLADANSAGSSNGSGDAKEKQKFAAGQIMQRYDPTKDTGTKIEKAESKTIQPEKEIEEDEQDEEQNEAPSPVEEASVSSESSESLSAEEEQVEEEEEKTATKTAESPSTNAVIEESKEDVYEQDELENVFKQSRQQKSTSASGGFSFGFQVPSEATNEQSNQNTSFTFGFNVSDKPKVDEEVEKDPNTDRPSVTVEEKRAPTKERARRVGLSFPESDLDDYEDLFFSLNEGPQILKDFDAMKQDEDNQTQWQKEREQLTSDWKRKQKAAQSRRVKQKRR